MIPFHVDDYMRDRAAGLMLLLGETRDEVEEKILRDIIRDGKDLIRRLEAKLPKKNPIKDELYENTEEPFVFRYSLYAWSPYYFGGGQHQHIGTFEIRETAIKAALMLVDPNFPGLQFWKIMDNEELRTTEIIVYPSLKWRDEDGIDRGSGEDISGDAKGRGEPENGQDTPETSQPSPGGSDQERHS